VGRGGAVGLSRRVGPGRFLPLPEVQRTAQLPVVVQTLPALPHPGPLKRASAHRALTLCSNDVSAAACQGSDAA
jgi:hypothetical protein